jgi:hypothetical protein
MHPPQEKSLRRIFQLRQQKVDIATALLAWKGKYIASIKEVLMTESTPRICWLPSAHNERTKKMLENRNEEVNYGINWLIAALVCHAIMILITTLHVSLLTCVIYTMLAAGGDSEEGPGGHCSYRANRR